MKKPTIIIVNDSPIVNGGTAMVALLEAKLLKNYGYDVKLFTAGIKLTDSNSQNNFEHISTEQLDVYSEPNIFFSFFRGLWNARAAKKILDTIEGSHNPNIIIHLYGWTKALTSSVINAARKKNITIVCSLFDYFVACPNGGFYNFKKNTVCKLRPLSLTCILSNCDSKSYSRKLWRVLRHLIQRHLGGIPGGIFHYIGCSELSASLLKPFLPKKSVIHFISNPIVTKKSTPVDVAKNDVYIFVGRLSMEKGPLLFAEAAHRVGVKAIFVGEGDCRTEIENRYPNFLITGWISSDKVSMYLRSARALVFPSLWVEPQGLVVLEAAAIGIPAIIPNFAAATEVVDDKVSGLWFSSGDVLDLSQKISQLNNDSYLSRLGANAYTKYWANPSTPESYVSKLSALYRSLL
jgi:glycosyltransferase involved in cell wall biosynthesis